MHILIAPNAFKNSLGAAEAAEAISKGFAQCRLKHTSECFPIGDGGDGTADLLIKKFNGVINEAEVQDPLGRKITASFGLIDDGQTAVIELANASGIKLLQRHELNPLQASTFGTGELIKHALDKNVKKIISNNSSQLKSFICQPSSKATPAMISKAIITTESQSV